MPRPSALACALAVGCALAAAGLSAAPASAASGDLAYSCEWGVDATEGTDPGTASWDTAVADDLVVDTGTSVEIAPYSGTITLPDAFVAALRTSGRTRLAGGTLLATGIAETDEPQQLELGYGPVPIPAEGPVVLDVDGIDEAVIQADDPGTYTLLADSFYVFVEEDVNVGLRCTFDGEGDPVVDRFRAVGDPVTEEPTDTTAPTAVASPVRPALVQTDVAEGTPGGSTGGPLLAAGAAVLLGLAGRRALRRAPRRH
ncbi:hypothetical protein G7075_19665 [Phycicoccus sp. HDW14]|uniref:hypothetical protein n=1 Tax=Phycicoccus sp. HDW14 TaxID=2714941 RepID=UPI001409593A|nr:hypothetical protein [Phycicoccus sp. HDW14]QIM22832.1 hypothetical protein G7075_19665 [Phycicoccus sp. HDW14]